MTGDDVGEVLGVIAKIIGILVLAISVLYAIGWLIVTPLEWALRLVFGS